MWVTMTKGNPERLPEVSGRNAAIPRFVIFNYTKRRFSETISCAAAHKRANQLNSPLFYPAYMGGKTLKGREIMTPQCETLRCPDLVQFCPFFNIPVFFLKAWHVYLLRTFCNFN